MERRRGPPAGHLFALWALGVSIPLVIFSAARMAVLPVAKQPTGVHSAGRWRVVHVLAPACPYSRSVIDCLLKRGARPDLAQEVVLIGEDASLSERVARARLSGPAGGCGILECGADGVLFFQTISPDGAALYSGTYFAGKARSLSGFLDLQTLAEAQAGRSPASRPVYGCPTSQRLESRLDPVGLSQL